MANDKDKVFRDYTAEIVEFFRKEGVKVDPEPKIVLKAGGGSRFDPFVPTGNYRPDTMTITLYVGNRHVKDILRTFCHELFHHSQNLKDPERFAAFDKSGKVAENSALERVEGDAYKNGNLLFRKWTEERD